MRQALVQLTAPDHMLGRASSAALVSRRWERTTLGQMEVSFVWWDHRCWECDYCGWVHIGDRDFRDLAVGAGDSELSV